jgi:hypothetical protein
MKRQEIRLTLSVQRSTKECSGGGFMPDEVAIQNRKINGSSILAMSRRQNV